MGSDPTSSRIGEAIRALRNEHPLITAELRARPSSGTRQGLKTGEVDIGLVLGQPVNAGFTYYELANVVFRVAGPAEWKEQIESASWAELARLPWLTPADNSMAYSIILRQLFDERGLELNSVARCDNAAIGRALLEAGVGLMLMREEHAMPGVQQGILAVSPLVRTEVPIFIAHVAGRRSDPLIRAFLDAMSEVWPGLSPTLAFPEL